MQRFVRYGIAAVAAALVLGACGAGKASEVA